MFYKLIDDQTLEKFKNPLRVDNKHIFTNSEKVLNEHGYYKVVNDPMPEEQKENVYYTSKYEVIDNVIHKVWEEKEFETIEEEIIESNNIPEDEIISE